MSPTDQATTSTGWHADGEASTFTIVRRRPANEVSPEKDDWLARIRVNGELSLQQQEALVGKMAAATSATAATTLSEVIELLEDLAGDDEIPADIRDRIRAHLGLATAASYTDDLPF